MTRYEPAVTETHNLLHDCQKPNITLLVSVQRMRQVLRQECISIACRKFIYMSKPHVKFLLRDDFQIENPLVVDVSMNAHLQSTQITTTRVRNFGKRVLTLKYEQLMRLSLSQILSNTKIEKIDFAKFS